MKSKNIRALIVILSSLTLSASANEAPHHLFNLSGEFSFKQNPQGVWRFGYSSGQSLAPGDFRLDDFSDPKSPIGFWHPQNNQGPGAGYYPYVAFNTSNKTEYGSSNGWAARAGEVAMEASNTGQYSIVRFVAPQSGRYVIQADFAGIHFGPSSTDVHVTHNGGSLFESEIEGYGGDPVFHAVVGAHPNASYRGEVELKTGDTIDFAVGYGRNKTHFSDTTGLFAKIEWVK